MYLTRIDLQPEVREVQRALGDCQQMHRMVNGLFQTARKDAGLLYRLRAERGVTALYLYSNVPVDKSVLAQRNGMTLAGERDLTDWLTDIQNGQLCGFDLLAAPTKKVAEEGHKNSRRRILREQEERLDWLSRKAAQHGFALVQAKELEGVHLSGKHTQERGGRMYWDGYHYTGILQVVDAARFCQAVAGGIGAGKAYGMGMLLLRRQK